MDDSHKPIIVNIKTIPNGNFTKMHDPQHPNHTCVSCRGRQKQAQRDGKVGYVMCANCSEQAKVQQEIAKAQEELERLRARVRQLENITSENDIGHDLAAAELHEAARQACHCSGFRCTAHLAQDELRRNRPTVTAVIGMRHMVAELNEAYAEHTGHGHVVLAMLNGVAEGEGPNDRHRLAMHKHRIDQADEVFVVNFCGQTDALVNQAIEYAELCGKPIRWLVQP